MMKAHTTATLTLITIFGNTALTCCGCIACNRKKKKKEKKPNPYKSEKEIKIEKTMTVSQRVKAIIAQSKRLFTTRAYIHFLLGTAAT